MTLVSQTVLASSKAIAAGTLSIALVTPFVGIESATAASFSDVSFSHWARPFINTLAQNEIINGYEDGSFRPDATMTRGQFAQLTNRAFSSEALANTSLYDTQPISRVQALVMLSNRLGLESEQPIDSTLSMYKDAIDIPSVAREGVAAATENQIVVNYPNVQLLMPYQSLSRAEAAAFVHQALVHQGQLQPINQTMASAAYIVDQPQVPATSLTSNAESSDLETAKPKLFVPAGTQIPLEYPGGQDVNLVIAPDETYRTTLSVASEILDSRGDILIPKGSRIRGDFVPLQINGQEPATQFVARRLIINGMSYPIKATSNPRMAVSQSEVDPDALDESIASAAAKSIVRSIERRPSSLGRIFADTFGIGTSSPKQEDSVIIIEPDSLTLTTQARSERASR